MGANQVSQMEPRVAETYKGISGPDDLPTLSCTLESKTPSGAEVWIQVWPETVNMGYPFTREPLEFLRNQCVDSPPGLYLVEWSANEYATVGFDGISPREHASFVDQLFVRVLGCDDASYAFAVTIEEMET
jgi:hypothetical protein